MAKEEKKKKKKSKEAHTNAPSKAGIASRIKPVKQIEQGVTCVFYGRSGTGKTTLAGSFPGPVLLIDIKDNGSDSVVDVPDMDVLAAETWEDLEEVYWYVAEGEGRKYRTVILDTMSQMQGLAVLEVKRQANREPDSPMSQQLWGSVSGLMQQWLLAFRDLGGEGRNVVFIAQDRSREVDEDADDDQIMPSVGPALSPSVAKIILAAVNVVGCTFIASKAKQINGKLKKKSEYHLRLGPHPVYVTKIRSPLSAKVPESIKNPTYAKILQVIRGEYTPDEEGEKKKKKK